MVQILIERLHGHEWQDIFKRCLPNRLYRQKMGPVDGGHLHGMFGSWLVGWCLSAKLFIHRGTGGSLLQGLPNCPSIKNSALRCVGVPLFLDMSNFVTTGAYWCKMQLEVEALIRMAGAL